jgi:FMN phosphatase YigB (HAD superfamily)
MITTLLFDLDDTLLGNDMGTFIPAYFEQITCHFPAVDPQQLINALMSATRATLANRDASRNLSTILYQRLFPAMGWEQAEWLPRFEEFYRTRFTHLRGLTEARPATRPLLEWAIAAGYEVVIATSPLFPRLAIKERLRWAGIADLPFVRVTSLENSHFTKPHPEYFAEILAHLGRRPEEALMVGNDWENDIAPSVALGLANYWIAPSDSAPPAESPHTFGIGSLPAFWEWAKVTLSTLTLPPPPATALPHLLRGNLAAIVGALDTATEATWQARPDPAEWSLTEIVCHLRDVDVEVNVPRFHAIVETDNPFISGADTHPWAVERDYQSQSGPEALKAFCAARGHLADFLAGQPLSVWNRTARHALFGPTTLAEIVGWILDHDRIHLEQLQKTGRSVASA